MKTSLFLLWKRIFGTTPAGSHGGNLAHGLTLAQETALLAAAGPEVLPTAWVVPCVSGRSLALPGHRPNQFGTLVAPLARPGTLIFISKTWFRHRAVVISLAGATVRQESTFLSENLVVHRPDDGLHLVFRFTRAEGALVNRLVATLEARLGLAAPLPLAPAAQPSFPASLGGAVDAAWGIPPPLRH